MKPVCQAPKCGTPTDGALCGQHTLILQRHLAELPSRLKDLQITIARLDRLNGNGRGRYVTRRVWSENDDPEYTADTTLVANPLPFSWDAALIMEAANGTLLSWARHLSESRGLLLSSTNLAVWLTRNVAAIAVDVAGGQAYDELVSLSSAVREAVDRKPVQVFVGPCGKESVRFMLRGDTLYAEDVACTAELYAVEGKATITCGRCGAEHDVAERRKRMLAAADDEKQTAQVIADGFTGLDLAVSANLIRQWAVRSAERRRRGLMPGPHEIYPVGTNEQGYPLYRVGDIRVKVEAAREAEKTRQAERAHNRKTRAA